VALIAKILFSDPERHAWFASVYKSWMESPDIKDRRAAFEQLLFLAPNAAETLAAFQSMMKAGDPDHVAEIADRRLLRWHSFLVDECLAGNDAQRRFIFACALEETRMKANEIVNLLGSVFSEEQLQRVERQQEAALIASDATVADVDKSCEFLT